MLFTIKIIIGFMYKKGYSFEREYKQKLESDGWTVIRSGGSKKPDLIAAKDGAILVVECKSTKKGKVYLDKLEVENLKKVALSFGGKGVYVIKQTNKGHKLINLDQLKEVGEHYCIDLK